MNDLVAVLHRHHRGRHAGEGLLKVLKVNHAKFVDGKNVEIRAFQLSLLGRPKDGWVFNRCYDKCLPSRAANCEIIRLGCAGREDDVSIGNTNQGFNAGSHSFDRLGYLSACEVITRWLKELICHKRKHGLEG
ncbi:hypothetical protein QSG27_27335 [Azospirillum sp. C340-1]|uniref:Uncharacterized protein n=1 Tax=Azospirillum isscasi TaxID=3053926 RepID=A0ABU0WUN2_9PROT|nr:hypothetical protein [Azospirillum isscasi]MDQ2106434.1 hypothetical protein [Azospirillum isscasi]